MKLFGEYFREIRKNRRITLRQFCRDAQADPGNVSKIERGILPPPTGETLSRYIEALGLKKGDEHWYSLTDLAATQRGIIPQDIANGEVAQLLPAFFRTIRGQKPGKEELKKIIDLINSER